MNTLPITMDTIAARLTILEQEFSRNEKSHKEIYGRLEKIEYEHASLQTELKNIYNLLNEISLDVKDMKSRPIKRYDNIINSVLQWLIIAILGASIVLK